MDSFHRNGDCCERRVTLCIPLQELSNDPLNILRPASKLQHTLNLASAYCGPPEHHENENRRGRRHDARPHEPKVSTARQ